MTGAGIFSRPRTNGRRRTAGAVLVFYAAALALNAEGLLRNARRMPYGPVHDFTVSLIQPVAGVANTLRATALRNTLESWRRSGQEAPRS